MITAPKAIICHRSHTQHPKNFLVVLLFESFLFLYKLYHKNCVCVCRNNLLFFMIIMYCQRTIAIWKWIQSGNFVNFWVKRSRLGLEISCSQSRVSMMMMTNLIFSYDCLFSLCFVPSFSKSHKFYYNRKKFIHLYICLNI